MLLRMIHPSEEGARVTTFELFFDLVFVFAFTQVTRLMAETHTGFGVLQALIVLALLWWCWVSYGWLANQTRADRGVIRIGIILATIVMFVIAALDPGGVRRSGRRTRRSGRARRLLPPGAHHPRGALLPGRRRRPGAQAAGARHGARRR